MRRAGIDPAIVDECIMGNVVGAGLGQNPARQAALRGGLPDHVAALTINKVCGSGLKAVMLADQGIATGDIDIAVAGGMESMSNCPYLLPRVRDGLRMGNGEVVDSMIHDGLWCAFENVPHGPLPARRGRARTTSAREAQDAYAAAQPPEGGAGDRATAGSRTRSCRSRFRRRKGRAARRSTATSRSAPTRPPRRSATLKPAFKKDGTVTAGNAPGVNDGASALVVMADERAASLGLTPLARIVGQATSGLAPKFVLMTPVEAVRRVAEKVGWTLERRRSLRAERSVRRAGGRRPATSSGSIRRR